MKKKIAFISMTIIVGGLLYFTGIKEGRAYYFGPPSGVTGSPHDGQSCATGGCHDSHPLQSAQPWILSNVPIAGYTPGTIYTITAKAVKIGMNSFGFEISPQSTNGTELGKLIVTNSNTTQITSAKYIEQTQSGYQGTDSLVWSFNWKAPASGTGSVTFYGAFNCGSGNSSSSGTYVYPATLVIPENVAAGIANLEPEASSLSIFPNPAKEKINITFNVKETTGIEINMYGIDGRKISNLLASTLNEGEHTQTIMLPSAITPGIYIVQLVANGQASEQRIIIE